MTLRILTHVAGFFAVLVPLLSVGCTQNSTAVGWPETRGPKVLTSFAPIRCFALNVAGDRAAVRAVMSTQGPHHYQPGRSDAKLLSTSDLFLINGLGLDNGISVQMQQLSTNDKLKLIRLGELLPHEMLLEGGCACCKRGDDPDHKHEHDAHSSDPHVWMGIDQAVKMVESIRDALKAADPEDAAGYDRRAKEYSEKLLALKAEGIAMIKGKSEKQFVSFHGSMAYFAATFGLLEPEVLQDVAGHEPSPKQLKGIVDRCVAKKLRVIAIEPQYSAEGSGKMIVEELKNRGIADATLIVLDPLETVSDTEFNAGWYESKMRANLKALATALR